MLNKAIAVAGFRSAPRRGHAPDAATNPPVNGVARAPEGIDDVPKMIMRLDRLMAEFRLPLIPPKRRRPGRPRLRPDPEVANK
jgi:hypothetical protein